MIVLFPALQIDVMQFKVYWYTPRSTTWDLCGASALHKIVGENSPLENRRVLVFSVGNPGKRWGSMCDIMTKFGKWLSRPFCLETDDLITSIPDDKSLEVVIHGSNVVMFE